MQLSGTSLEWLLDTIANSDVESVQRKLLSTLIGYHWHKRCFRAGTLAIAPLLGRRVILEVRLRAGLSLTDDVWYITSLYLAGTLHITHAHLLVLPTPLRTVRSA